MKRGEIEAVYPLTPFQETVLARVDANGASGDYLRQLSVVLAGRLDAEDLRSIWASMLSRHAALRTLVARRANGRPLQLVKREVELDWSVENLAGVADQEQIAITGAWLQEDIKRPFDLTRAPLMRFKLFELGNERRQLVWTFHHIGLDCHSALMVLEEALLACRGEAVPVERGARFSAVVEVMAGKRASADAYWRRTLSGPLRPAPLAPAEIDGEVGAPTLETVEWLLDAEATRSLRAAAARHRVTLNTLVTGVWAALHARSSGRSEILFGIVSSGRAIPLDGIERSVGQLINHLPVSVTVDGAKSLAEWLGELQARLLDTLRHETVSTAEISERLGLPVEKPLFDVLLAFDSEPPGPNPGVAAGSLLPVVESVGWTAGEHGKFLLSLTFVIGETVRLRCHYDPLGLSGATVLDLTSQLRSALSSACAPDVVLIGELFRGIKATGTGEDSADTPAPTGAASPRPSPGSQAAQDGKPAQDPRLPRHKARERSGVWAPEVALQTIVRDLWEALLGRDDLTLDDDFFAVGGDSLLAVRCLSEIEEITGKALSVGPFVAQPTIRGIARSLYADVPWPEDAELIPVQTRGERPPLFCIHGDSFFLGRKLGSGQPLYWFTPWLRRIALAREPTPLASESVEEIAGRYLADIRRVQATGPYHLLGSCAGAVIAYELARQLAHDGDEVGLLVLIEVPESRSTAGAREKLAAERIRLAAFRGPADRAAHLMRRTSEALVRRARVRGRRHFDRLMLKFHLHTGKAMGLKLAREYTNQLQGQAIRGYAFPPYSGSAVFVRTLYGADVDAVEPGVIPAVWQERIGGQAFCYDILGCTHSDVFEEPHIDHLAEIIKPHMLDPMTVTAPL